MSARDGGAGVLKGYNTDLNIRGQCYHVQTEDWGVARACIVSHIFKNGAVIKKIKTPYHKAIPEDFITSSKHIKEALRLQHQYIIELLQKPKFVSPTLSKNVWRYD